MTNAKVITKSFKKSKPSQKIQGQFDEKTSLQNKNRNDSKQSMLVTLLKRPEGATIEEMSTATDWQRHSVRGVMSGVLKTRLKLAITSEKEERGRVYRIAI